MHITWYWFYRPSYSLCKNNINLNKHVSNSTFSCISIATWPHDSNCSSIQHTVIHYLYGIGCCFKSRQNNNTQSSENHLPSIYRVSNTYPRTNRRNHHFQIKQQNDEKNLLKNRKGSWWKQINNRSLNRLLNNLFVTIISLFFFFNQITSRTRIN